MVKKFMSMRLSIITINYNNASGLRKTLASVASQTYPNVEHIIVDGGSTDGSIDVIRDYENTIKQSVTINQSSIQVKWVSEPDNGIYNAMNKGIEIALGKRVVNAFNRSEQREDKHSEADRPEGTGAENKELCDYIQILNSGDILAAPDVTERMVAALRQIDDRCIDDRLTSVPILYGNMIKQWPDGRRAQDKCEAGHLSMLSFYHGTLNHDCAYIKRDLFDKFGLYDENLKIVSDWKWYLQAIPLGGITPIYVDIDVTIFDMTGVSESNTAFWKVERRPVLEALIPPMILADYDKYCEDMRMVDRLRKHHLYGLVYFIERVLFKLEKWKILR